MNIFKRSPPPEKPRPVKKQSCKIKIKKTSTGEQYEFSNCKPDEIEAFKQLKEQRDSREGGY